MDAFLTFWGITMLMFSFLCFMGSIVSDGRWAWLYLIAMAASGVCIYVGTQQL